MDEYIFLKKMEIATKAIESFSSDEEHEYCTGYKDGLQCAFSGGSTSTSQLHPKASNYLDPLNIGYLDGCRGKRFPNNIRARVYSKIRRSSIDSRGPR